MVRTEAAHADGMSVIRHDVAGLAGWTQTDGLAGHLLAG